MEKIVEIKICKQCNSKFEIIDKDLEFYEKVSPVFQTCHSELVSESLENKNFDYKKDSPIKLRTGSEINSGGHNSLIKNLGNGKVKYLVPTPGLCPDCRYQRKLSWRNERNLYKCKCHKCKKDIISMYSSNKNNIEVYCQECWWSDDEDFLTYSKDFDFSKSFFENFKSLYNKVPKVCLTNTYKTNENSPYVNYIVNAKNSYLCFGGGIIEDVAYSNFSLRTKNSFDIYSCDMCENCYELINCKNCFKVFYSSSSENCNNSYFLDNCEGCNFCIGCKNLKNKKYYIFNKESSKEEYQYIIKKLNIGGKELTNKIKEIFLKIPSKDLEIKNSENCIGNMISDSKNCKYCFNIKESEKLKYCNDVIIGQDIYDTCYVGLNVSKVYETINTSINTYNLLFSSIVRDSARDIIYSIDIHGGNNLFGCVGLKNKSYCILNKQYTKEQYEKLVPKIIEKMIEDGEWGEFFPSTLSPFGYNETVAQEYFPLSRSNVIPADAGIYSKEKVIEGNNDLEILKSNNSKVDSKNFREFIDSGSSQEGQTTNFLHGPIFNWSDYESPKPKVDKIIPASKLPEDIKEIPDDILNWAIECKITQKPFRIIKEELEFYRKHNIGVPRRHPDQRHLDRMKLRNPRKLYDRECDKCGKDIKTTYSPERKEIVYCEECYNKEIY